MRIITLGYVKYASGRIISLGYVKFTSRCSRALCMVVVFEPLASAGGLVFVAEAEQSSQVREGLLNLRVHVVRT